jgi:hypothetical protein
MSTTLAIRKKVAYCLAFDIVRLSADEYWPAPESKDSVELFSMLRLEGFAAAYHTGFAQKLVIVGGEESRYPGEGVVRSVEIEKMLVKQHGVDPGCCEYEISKQNTRGNIQEIKKQMKLGRVSIDHACVVSSYYHLARASALMWEEDLRLPLYPAESLLLIKEPGRLYGLMAEFDGSPFAIRAIQEIVGITDLIRGTSVPQQPAIAASA